LAPARREGDAAGLSQRLPLLLLHGLGCSADVWEPALRCLAGQRLDHAVWAPDMAGHGHSSGPPEALTIAELGDWAARLLDALAVNRAHVAAHSMGAQVALALARRHPERIGGLVLVGPTTGGRHRVPPRYAAGLVADGLCEPVLYTRLLVRMYREMGPRRYLAAARRMIEDDPFAGIAQVTARCLVARGPAPRRLPGGERRPPRGPDRHRRDLRPRRGRLPGRHRGLMGRRTTNKPSPGAVRGSGWRRFMVQPR